MFSVPVLAQDKATLEGRDQAGKELQDVRQNMALSREKLTELARQVDALKKDQRTMTAELVKAAKKEREAAENIASGKERLVALSREKQEVQKNLQERRSEFAEVLAALQRMGLKPPPAILVRPDDALTSVRSAVLLGAVVPDMKEKTLSLTRSLKELTALTHSISETQQKMVSEQKTQAEEQNRLALLLTEKAKLQKQSEQDIEQQRQVNRQLAEKAKSLEDLVTELDRLAHYRQDGAAPSARPQTQAEIDFDRLKGRLVRPVAGEVIRRFGQADSALSASGQGEVMATEPLAIVTAPADGMVAYADNFRSYGQMVILDVGKDYHLLLIGMGKTNVRAGQYVVSGEPIGQMAAQFIASATALDIGKSTPMLYIELRKQGKPVDPSSWWMKGNSGRNSNDS